MSFPRKRESRTQTEDWIPTYVGMTGTWSDFQVKRQLGSSLSDRLGNLCKSCRIIHSEVCEHLSVQLDAGLFQTVDKRAVRESVQSDSRINPRDPENPEVSLLLSPVAIGITEPLVHSLCRRPEETMLAAPESLCKF